MPQLLLIVGAILALVGMGSIAAGAPDWLLGLSLGATLIQSGTIAFVGGLILAALGMVLYVLNDLLRRLDSGVPAPAARPALEDRSRPPRPQPGRQAPPPESASRPRERERDRDAAAETPSEAAPREPAPGGDPSRARRERREAAPDLAGDDFPSQEISLGEPRPRRERPREANPEEIARPRRPAPVPPPSVSEERPRRPAPGPFGDEEPARRPRAAESPHEEIPRMRGERPRESRNEEPRREFSPIPSIPQPFGGGEGRRSEGGKEESYLPKFRPAEPTPPPRAPGSDTVVRSGVIGGMAYTLYVDGSIEAELPIGTVRFNSIAELQDHVMRTGTEADADFDENKR